MRDKNEMQCHQGVHALFRDILHLHEAASGGLSYDSNDSIRHLPLQMHTKDNKRCVRGSLHRYP